MSDRTSTTRTWRRAAACVASSCLEVADDWPDVLVRDSKHPMLAPLRFSRSEFAAFARAVKNGEFDDLGT
jgi:hypothetical protein